MNAPLRRVGVVVMVLFGLLFVNLNYVQAYKGDEYRNSDYNGRVQVAEYERKRGNIEAGGIAVATSKDSGGKLKFLRTYPKGEIYAHVLGYKPVNLGDIGIERSENDFLAGTSDQLFADRVRDLFTGDQTAGGNVLLTVSPRAQETAFKELADNRVGAVKGAAVAIDPRTGAIQALVSMPSFDPNPLASHDSEVAQAAYNKLAAGKNGPLRNRALTEVLPPGSTFKVIVAAAALENGTTKETRIPAGPSYLPPTAGSEIRNAVPSICPGAQVTLIQALTESCNTGFAKLGVALGAEKIKEKARQFGFENEELTVGRLNEGGLPVAASRTGEMSNPDGSEDPAALAQSSIGQNNVRMTPLEGAMMAAAVANNGRQMRPYLVQQLLGPDRTTNYYTASPKELRQSVSGQVAGDLRDMMVSVVENGTGRNARINNYTVGGKTGTAENGQNTRRPRLVHRLRDEGRSAHLRRRGAAGIGGFGWQWRGDQDCPGDHAGGHRRPGRPMTALSPGVLLGNRYRLDERIAGGGMGDVWRGTDEVLGRTVAVKSLLPALLDEPGFAERFRGEARTMATINHPGVVDVYDYGSDQQIAFLVMEYVEGDALSQTLSRVGRLTPARTMALVAQAADALQAAHDKGIVHRDVKPGNLLVRPNGTLVLTDFGIARSALVGQLTVAGSVLGTASYISPEQATGGVATPVSDVYSLGVVAYQCLSGRRPFEGNSSIDIALKHVRETARPLPADIPPAIRAIVDRAMAKEPATRWPTAAALGAVARQAAVNSGAPGNPGHPGIATQPSSPAGPPARRGIAPGGTRVMPPFYPPHPQQLPPAGPVSPPRALPAAVPVAPRHPNHPVPVPMAPRHPNHPVPVPSAPRHPNHPAPVSVPPAPRYPAASGPASVPPASYHRGAATVPSARPGPAPGYRYPMPQSGAPRAQSSGNRTLLIVLAIVVGLVVVTCSAMITYRVRQNAALPNPGVVPSGWQTEDGRDGAGDAPYRQVQRLVHVDELTR